MLLWRAQRANSFHFVNGGARFVSGCARFVNGCARHGARFVEVFVGQQLGWGQTTQLGWGQTDNPT